MAAKTEKSLLKRTSKAVRNTDADSWTPERMLDALMSKQAEVEQDWCREGVAETCG